MARDSSTPPSATGLERALSQVRGAGVTHRPTVGLAMGSGFRVGGAGKRRVCCQSGCAGCPWTRVVTRRASRGLAVDFGGPSAHASGDRTSFGDRPSLEAPSSPPPPPEDDGSGGGDHQPSG